MGAIRSIPLFNNLKGQASLDLNKRFIWSLADELVKENEIKLKFNNKIKIYYSDTAGLNKMTKEIKDKKRIIKELDEDINLTH